MSQLDSTLLESCPTRVDLLRWRAERQGNEILFRFLKTGDVNGPIQEWTSTHLDVLARAIGAMLQQAGAQGERVLLLYPPGLDYIAAFVGCLYAGSVAVPAYPPDPSRPGRTLPRLEALIADARPALVLSTSTLVSMASFLFEQTSDL